MIYRLDLSDNSSSGVINKMNSQKKAFQNLGHHVDLINHQNQSVLLNNAALGKVSNNRANLKFKLDSFFKIIQHWYKDKMYQIIYIRYPYSSSAFVGFCRKIKTQNPDTKVLLEIPTYPYKQEFEGIKKWSLVLERFWRSKLESAVDFLIHYGPEKTLFSIPCINSMNGIDVSQITFSEKLAELGPSITAIALGKWRDWHGLDRVIKGIKNTKMDVKLHIVGDGPVLEKLMLLVKELGLDQKVIFEGTKVGDELDRLYEKADIGIGTLGMHRKKVKYNSSLKHREYCAKGIPFILSTYDNAFSTDCSFVKYEKENDQSIDFSEVSHFLKELKLSRMDIRKYAQEKLDWKNLLGRVLDEVQ